MKRDYLIYINTDTKDNALKCVDIAFQAGKGHCMCAFTNLEKCATIIYVAGKWCDIIRIYSALKNNNFNPRMKWDDGENDRL